MINMNITIIGVASGVIGYQNKIKSFSWKKILINDIV